MHLIFENLMPNLIKHWTGEFKGLDVGVEDYQFEKKIWEAIGAATAAAGKTIPSVYGARVPDIAKDLSNFSAEMHSFWLMYIGPVLLERRFSRPKYYNHFVKLVTLVITCLQFEISDEEIGEVREGFKDWVLQYEKIYYQHDTRRVSACPLTVHALLHIADSIEEMGPVWCYWAFPMERYCGTLSPAIKSRRFPYASLDRHVVECAQLEQINAIYNTADEMSLRAPRKAVPRGGYAPVSYPSCILLPPKDPTTPVPEGIFRQITAALATRASLRVQDVRPRLLKAQITRYGRVRRVDSDEGDTMCAVGLVGEREDLRDASFVRYEALFDRHAHARRRAVSLQPDTYFGQLKDIYLIQFPDASDAATVGIDQGNEVVLAAIRECANPTDHKLLDIHYYTTEGRLDIVDMKTVQALVGRIWDIDRWAIVDRSGSLARAVFCIDDL
ncbi:hypothetical protein K525DRAFT_203997 [Schizophyllum commune Loenen D]|nr:hypothetical protein K525DRAFT_203997 [Schizophyllum commune Loenen D]